MEKIIINGVEFCNFGENNYTNGMKLITCYPAPANIVQDVLAGKYPNVWLNPSAKCDSEFYGLLGSKEQYEKVYKEQRQAQIARKLLDRFGWDLANIDLDLYNACEKEIITNYKDWWE